MNERLPTLGLLPPLNGGLATLAQAGQQDRLIEQYFRCYARAFGEMLYFSYFQESLEQYTDEAVLLSRIKILAGQPGRLYTFRLPFHWAAELRRCQVLRVFQITGAIPAALARLRWRIPFAATYGYRYATFARAEGYTQRALALWLLEQIGLHTANAVIVTTPALQAHVRQVIPAERVHLIPNGVDTTRFTPAPCLLGTGTLIFVGRLERQKNLFLCLESMAQLRTRVRLLLVGDGSQRQELLATAARLGVAVEWLGVVSHQALPALLQSADIFVLPSHMEGQPKALLEAMSCGLPCVGLDVPGTRDVIEHEVTGLLAPPTAGGLAEMLHRLLDNGAWAARLGQAGRRRVEQQFSTERVMEQEINLLYHLAGRT